MHFFIGGTTSVFLGPLFLEACMLTASVYVAYAAVYRDISLGTTEKGL